MKEDIVGAEKTGEGMVKDLSPAAPNTQPAATDEPVGSIDNKDVDAIISILNEIDMAFDGKGEIKNIPPELQGVIGTVINQMIGLREAFEDPLFKGLLDDMIDQKEDGKTPSVEVAIARSIPIEKLQELADSEDYEGAQASLVEGINATKKTAEEDAEYEAKFDQSQKAGDAYAAKMGYDETRKNELFQKVLDLFKIMGDGILTEAEFADVDKMLNYGPDTESLRAQISSQGAKEVLPDKASLDAAVMGKATNQSAPVKNTPGLGSMSAYENIGTDINKVGHKGRQARQGRV